MKKAIFIATLSLCLAILASCGDGTYEDVYVYEYAHEYECKINNQDEYPYAAEEHNPNALFLYDFDHMFFLMENTFPFFGVAQRRMGVDIHALASETRRIIAGYPETREELRELAAYNTQTFWGRGQFDEEFIDTMLKLRGLDRDLPYMDNLTFRSIVELTFFLPMQQPYIAHAQMLGVNAFNTWRAFYGASMPSADHSPFMRFNFETFVDSNAVNFYREIDAIHEMLVAQVLGDTQSEPARPPQPIVTTQIIEEGRIAYMNVSTFQMTHEQWWQSFNTVMEFYSEIQDYEHLIIDIRENSGGGFFWMRNIMHPLASDDVRPVPMYAFFLDNDFSRTMGEMLIRDMSPTGFWGNVVDMSGSVPAITPETAYLIPIDELLADKDLPHLNADDRQTFGYGARLYAHLDFNGGERLPFNGQIWLLTSFRNGSASAHFAHHAKYSGFATLVGGTTSYANISWTFFALPGTGMVVSWDTAYITDQFGRTWEEFPTEPHYFSRPGMDALETVLAMIEEAINNQ